MQTTIRKNQLTVDLSAAANEFLKYHLQVIQGAGAIFGWTDDNGTPILPLPGSPGAADNQWQLKSAMAGGNVQLTVPQNAGYLRNETSPNIVTYSLMLFFPTALKYTLTIDQCNSDGTLKQSLVDIDFTGSQNEQAPHVEVVNL
jgi:hypothetical protein